MMKKFLLFLFLLTTLTAVQGKGTLTVKKVASNAVRIQYQETIIPDTLPDWLYVKHEEVKNCDIQVEKDNKNQSVTLKDRNGKVLFHATRHELSRGGATLAFDSPKDEYLFGLGQFQDGYSNVRGLSRRLTQVNTQISLPMLLSSKGYGILWNNYGLTEFNPCSHQVALTKSNETSRKEVVNVTSTEGNKQEVRERNLFEADIEVFESGDYALLLDVGQKMARRHNLTVDGNTVIEMQNLWLPPTASKIVHLTTGHHHLTAELANGDQPVLYYNKVKNETVFHSPIASAVDYTVFVGSADEIIATYRDLTGQAPLMPDWALGYIHCRERFHSSEEILQTAKRFREEKMPISMIVQDWQYWGKYGWNSMTFDEEYYPEPKALTDSLHKMDIRMMLSVWSKIDKNSEVGRQMEYDNYYIPGTDWIDFFNPDAAATYWKNFRERLVPLGIDAWWQDATEPENDDLAGRRVNKGRWAGELVRNVYPLLVNKTVYEGLVAAGREPMILTRSGFPGIQRYGSALWSGDVGNDWETFRRQITAGLGVQAAGIPWWTYDAGGFFRPQNQYTDSAYIERMLRWIETSVFLPLMRVHGYMSNTEPWNYGPEAQAIITDCLKERQRLLPYIKECAKRISTEGYTLMRPLIFDFADDPEALQQKYEYMFGPDLLISPITEPGVTTWKTYLPKSKGGWKDYRTGQHYEGGQTVTTSVDKAHIPVFIREKNKIVEEGGTGPYKAIMKEEVSLPAHTVLVPQDLSMFNAQKPLPVLVWGNGACTNSPWEHFKFLNEIASNGFLVLATSYIPMEEEPYKGPMSTTQQQIESIDWAFKQNADPASPYYQKIDTKNICVAGMSCGGLQALFNCADPRITTLMICNSGLFNQQNANQAVGGMPMPPKEKLKEIHTPVIYILGGETDIAYGNGMDDFHRIQHVPACAINYPVGHGGTYRQPHGGEFTIPALAWLQWQLKGDKEAAKMFIGKNPGILKRKDWTIEKNAVFDQQIQNPMLWADVPDPDVIRVGDTYYMVSTTMHLMPGGPIMASKDLKHWETVGYIFDRLTDSPKYDLLQGTAYGRGQWATSLKYHNGKFYALLAPNEIGAMGDTYIFSADKAEGPWHIVSRMRHFHDCSLFFDDDNRVYAIYGTGEMMELKPDLSDVIEGTHQHIFQREADEKGLLEGSRMIKHNGKYYLLMISHVYAPGKHRREVCYRADDIHGPYEKQVILESEFGGFSYEAQGTIVDTPEGDWYGIIFQDRGGVGRVLTTMPCRWINGWPMLGDEEGKVPEFVRPTVALTQHQTGQAGIVKSDDFSASELGLHWQWNHNPINEAWSLTERPGTLRLKTNRVVHNLYLAPNTLTQRMEGPTCSGVIEMDVSKMKDGDCAGLAAFNSDTGALIVKKQGKKFVLEMVEMSVTLTDKDKEVTDVTEKVTECVPLNSKLSTLNSTIYLRIDADFRPSPIGGKDAANFYYSLDGKQWKQIGTVDYKMHFDWRRFFMGTKFGIFCYATKKSGGYVDILAFNYQKCKN